MNERDAYIALNMMDRVGPVSVRGLADQLGSCAEIFTCNEATLRRAAGGKHALVEAILSQRDLVAWEAEIEKAESMGIELLTPVDAAYPRPLLDIHDPPLALYVKGSLQAGDQRALAIVGTRRPTHYGRDVAEQLSGEVARVGFTVISGLALGIDTVSHRAALDAKGRTVAVIGSALDCLYPPGNKALAREITGHGAVISEYPFGRHPDKTTFPMRNRIVSGLSMGILVVEAGMKSGALITARQALEQGRSVFAVPGRIDSPASAGTHDLIQGGARLVTDLEDILQEYEFLIPASVAMTARKQEKAAPVLDGDEGKLTAALEAGEQDVDQLIRACGLSAGAVSSLLLGLEMKRVVRMLPGRRVELIRGHGAGVTSQG